MPSADAHAALRPLPAGYAGLFHTLLHAAEQDDRIRALWLGGSLGRGVADAGSDLDVVLAIAPGSLDDFASSWRDWLAGVTPTVFARQLPGHPGSWYSVTPACLRLDVVAERAGTATAGQLSLRLLVLDKDGTASLAAAPDSGQAGEASVTPPGPSRARLAGLTEEFLRQQAIFPAAVVARRDWLLGVQGVQGAQVLLYELFVESNQPLPPMGVKQWSAKLTPEQVRICTALPAPTANPDSVLAAMRATAAAFRAAARQILAAHDIAWPAEFDHAVQTYCQAALGWTG